MFPFIIPYPTLFIPSLSLFPPHLPAPRPHPPRHPLPPQIADKADLLRKGTAAMEAAKKLAPAAKALQDDRQDWVEATLALSDY